jgi:malonate-semialdehyde dehydrogenase (acetylating)/methylmalonate-semialdehyde dehydrogenase
VEKPIFPYAAKHLIGGEWQDGAGTGVIKVTDPATGEIVSQMNEASSDQVDAAVEAAAAAFPAWSALSINRRSEILLKAKQIIEEKIDELAHVLSVDNGKTLAEARGEIGRAAEVIANAASAPMIFHSESGNVAGNLDARRVRIPLGVVAAISPFNFPMMNPSQFASWALVCGNTLVLKPSEQTPMASNLIISMFKLAGVPDGVINIVHGFAEVGKALCSHPKVAAISCITSTPVARAIYTTGTANGKRVQANGGGKNPYVVLADADLGKAVDGIADAAFGMGGQRCLAASRCIVHADIYDAFLEALIAKAKTYVLGNGRDPAVNLGPLVSAASKTRVLKAIDDAVAAGGKLVLDGRVHPINGDAKRDEGNYVGPSIVTELSYKHPVDCQETFGPFLVIHKVSSFEEAVEISNHTEFGNAAAIYTQSGKFARDFEQACRSGNIGVNTFPAPPMNFTMGGMGTSFFGDIHVCGDGPMHFYTDHKMVVSRW